MANNPLETPFNVKLTSKATAFHCMESRFSIHGTQVKTVKVLTDQIRQTIMAGGLEVTEEEATKVTPTGLIAKADSDGEGAPKKPAAGTGKPSATGASKAKSAAEKTAARKAAETTGTEEEGGEGEPSVEDILQQQD